MYKKKLKDFRIKIKCLHNDINNKLSFIDAIFDTGAIVTLFTASSLDLNIEDFMSKRSIEISGFAEDRTISIYKVKVKQLIIGNIDLGE